jgi:hypothetical protein
MALIGIVKWHFAYGLLRAYREGMAHCSAGTGKKTIVFLPMLSDG